MNKLLIIFFLLPVISLSQGELIIKGKMIFDDVKEATVHIVEVKNPTDTTTVKIEKKRFKLNPLDITKSYELIFTCNGRSKTLYINIEKQEQKIVKSYFYYLEVDWTFK